MPAEKGTAVHVSTLPTVARSTYPEPFSARMGDRVKRRLGEAFGLQQFGVNLVTLGAGGQSALRHWHTHEDELVYVMSGELVLVTNAGEQTVSAGMVVGFPGGDENAHHFINRSGAPAQYIEVGTRVEADAAYYPDDDLKWLPDGSAGHKDGTKY